MGVISYNGILYGGGGGNTNAVYLTQAEYDALPDTKLTDGKVYFIEDATPAPDFTEAAENVFYNGTTGQPNNVQDMLELLSTKSYLQIQKGSVIVQTSSTNAVAVPIEFDTEFENKPVIIVSAMTPYESFGFAEASARKDTITVSGFTGLLKPQSYSNAATWEFNWIAIAETTANATSLGGGGPVM